MTIFKICGLRTVEHATAATDAGASFLGFNFVPGVRRQISETEAKDIIQEILETGDENRPKLVGLFANQPLEDVNRIIVNLGLDYAQLCGDESDDYLDKVAVPVMRQVKVREDKPRQELFTELSERLSYLKSNGHIALLDKHEAGSLGGTGRTFDWSIAAEVAKNHEIMLAGGLTPENVGGAIRVVSPWAVDVSSGVETDGVKDPTKIKSFAKAVADAASKNLRV